MNIFFNKLIFSLKRLTVFSFAVSLFAVNPLLNAFRPNYSDFAYRGREYSEVTIAVIDSGINADLQIFKDHLWINTDEIPDNQKDDDGNGYKDDVFGWDFYNNDNTLFHNNSFSDGNGNYIYEEDHGTSVASIIAEVGTVIPVRMMTLKVNGGKSGKGQTSDAVKAIRYAEENGAQICNISWGTYENDPELYNAIKESSMLFVCAAGNDGTDNDMFPLYPASYELDNIISVACITDDGKLSTGANYGLKTVDIGMFGENVLCNKVRGKAYMSGSSFAAARVTAMAALAYAHTSSFCADVVKKDIICTSITFDKALEGNIMTPGYPTVKNIYERLVQIDKELQYAQSKPQKLETTEILLNVSDVYIRKNEIYKLVYKCLPLGTDVAAAFSSYDTAIVSVDNKGNLVGVSKGDTYITVTCGRAQKTVTVHVR